MIGKLVENLHKIHFCAKISQAYYASEDALNWIMKGGIFSYMLDVIFCWEMWINHSFCRAIWKWLNEMVLESSVIIKQIPERVEKPAQYRSIPKQKRVSYLGVCLLYAVFQFFYYLRCSWRAKNKVHIDIYGSDILTKKFETE